MTESSAPARQSSAAPQAKSEAPVPRARRLWMLWGILAGLFGFVATILLDVRPWTEADYEKGGVLVATAADMVNLDPLMNKLGFLVGFAAVASLIVFHSLWRLHIERARPRSGAARVFGAGLVVTASGLTLAYGWKGSLALYGHGGAEFGSFDDTGLLIFYALTDFGAFIPWFGVIVSFAALAWMAWAEQAVSRIAGTLAAGAALLVVAGYAVTGVPGLAGPVGGLTLTLLTTWMLVGRRGVIALAPSE